MTELRTLYPAIEPYDTGRLKVSDTEGEIKWRGVSDKVAQSFITGLFANPNSCL